MGAAPAAEEQFGPYLVYERLGVGGMATVHRALERGIEGFERIVALKRLLPHLAADASFIKSFVREAKLASLLNHVNIVRIFELGRVATHYFISMEYIDGSDVRRILRHARKVSGPPPIHVTTGLLLQLCDALDYAHTKVDDAGHPMGLVHRDVSPSNVLVTSAGQVKVIDFGIAKAQSVQLRTQTGRVKGKLAYMAPEALAGKDLDARSDLFAVGVIGHELLTARPLFSARNEYETLMKVQRGEVVPPSTFNQGCPPELDAIVLRALARDPDDRFVHASDLRDELHAMRKRYNLQTAERDIASWLAWAFSLETPGEPAGDGRTEVDGRALPRPRRTRRHDDEEAIELAWGGHEEHNAEPIVLDDVPDVSAKHLQHPSALGADVRLDVDDLDDIPTPLPSHGRPVEVPSQSRPTVDLKGRTATTPQLPRQLTRSNITAPPAQARGSQAIPAQPADTQPSAAVVPSAPVGRVAAVSEPSAGIRSAVIPSRVRTITLPPRAVPSSSAPPRNVAAAVLPPRAAESSRGVPLSAAPSRSGPAPAESLRGAATELSQGVPVPIDASDTPVPAAPSRRAPAGNEPSRSRRVPSPRNSSEPAAPRMLPSATNAPRRAAAPRASSPPIEVIIADAPGDDLFHDTVLTTAVPPGLMIAPAPAAPVRDASRDTPLAEPPRAAAGRDSLSEMTTSRTPKFTVEDLGLAADTMPSMPAMPASEAVRAREAVPATSDGAKQPDATPPPDPESTPPSRPGLMTGTARSRLITPATALFAEPEPEPRTTTTVAAARSSRPSHAMIPGGETSRGRTTLARVLMVVIAFVVVSAATTAAALYLTRDDDAPLEPPRAAPPTPSKAAGTVHFEIAPAGAAILIDGKPMHVGAPWDIELGPGVHQIEIDRAGYKGWLTSIELAAGQTQRLDVALESLGSAVAAEATLMLGSTPGGLDIVIDGAVVGKTPDKPGVTGKLPLPPGHHKLALRASGVEVWSKDIEASTSAVQELRPRVTVPSAGSADPAAPAPPAGDPPAAPAHGDPPTGSAATAPQAAPPAPAPSAPTPSAPVTVPATAVTRLSGAAPRVTASSDAELPPSISVRICIDETGRVTTAAVTTPVAAATATEITDALQTWRYAPYSSDGAPRAACFSLTFRVK